MNERRFNEDEVAAIFERAAEAQQPGRRQLPSGEGMTLADLQEIGREVGISPDLVAQAAKSVEQGGRPTSRSFLGLPIGVGRTIELDRKLTEKEWEQLVVDLRETFDARGRLKQEGSFRQWTNGNLQALVEPIGDRHRVRLRTLKGDARSLMLGGLGMLGAAAASVIATVAGGGIIDVGKLGVVAMLGVILFGIGALRVPGWARLRRSQMEEVAARLTATTATPADRLIED